MESGLNYTLSFWGTDQISLNRYYSHPTKQACLWGCFYEEDTSNYPSDVATPVPRSTPDSTSWVTAPGITDGGYITPSNTPKPMPTPSN